MFRMDGSEVGTGRQETSRIFRDVVKENMKMDDVREEVSEKRLRWRHTIGFGHPLKGTANRRIRGAWRTVTICNPGEKLS